LVLQQPTALPKAASPNTPPPPKPEAKSSSPPPPKPEAKKPAPPPPKPEAEAPVPSRKPEVAKPASKPKDKAPPRAKPVPAESAPQTPPIASSREAHSAIEALRQRQAEREQEQQQTQARQRQAASERVAALRDQLEQHEAVGATAVTAAGVQHVRLMAYQDRVRGKIIEAWILPLSAEQTRDLQATAQFQVTRHGHVEQLELVKPSGNTLFDTSLLRAIRRASPLPTLPEEYPLDVLEVEMRFRADS
jgi:TonB family protein